MFFYCILYYKYSEKIVINIATLLGKISFYMALKYQITIKYYSRSSLLPPAQHSQRKKEIKKTIIYLDQAYRIEGDKEHKKNTS